jgi:hypothetical protein
MNRDYYRRKIQEMLDDPQNYQHIESNVDKKTTAKIKQLCAKYSSFLTKKEKDFLINFLPKTSNFYGLPKIHKSEEIKNAIQNQNSDYITLVNPEDLKFRPIVAGPICPTSRLSNMTDILLQPFLEKINSYVRDDIQFLNFIPQQTDPNTLLATFDVTSLYSNIPHELGRQAIEYWIREHPDILHNRFNEKFVLDSIEIILTNNTFQFDNRNYLQLLGTAMGTKMAPTYATLTLAFLEINLYQAIKEKYGDEIEKNFKNGWKRYLDDCFIFWDQKWGNITDFFSLLQNLHPKIDFTMDNSSEEIPFLDILIRKNSDGTIITDIYRKPTDSQRYLHFRSHHPDNCKKAVPLMLARRICTIVTDPALLNKRLDELEDTLRERGYPLPLIKKGINLAKGIPLEDLRTSVERNKTQPITFVSTFNRRNPKVFPEVYKHFQTLQEESEIFKKISLGSKLIKSERQPSNIKQILTSAKFETQPTLGVKKCNKKKCILCGILIEGNSYKIPNQQREFKIRSNLTCTLENVIYIIECTNCEKFYLGATTLEFNKRINLHRSQILHEEYRALQVSKHIHECANGNFRTIPILQDKNKNTLFSKEEKFIKMFSPPLNTI